MILSASFSKVISILLIINTYTASFTIIDVERNYHDYNDRFTPGSLRDYEYKCNSKGGAKCECYFRGTYFSPEGKQAICQKDGVCPNQQRTTVTTYRDGMTLTLTNPQFDVQNIFFWTLVDGRESGTFIDYTVQASQYFKIRTNGDLVVSGIPSSWQGQLLQINYKDGACFFLKIGGTIKYPFDFSTIFTSTTTVLPLTTATKTKTIKTNTEAKASTKTSTATPSTLRLSTSSTAYTTGSNTLPTKKPQTSSLRPTTTTVPHQSSSSPSSAGQSESNTTPLSDNKPLVIALVVTTLIIIILTAVIIVVCRKRYTNGKGPEGSINYKSDKAVYVSPTDGKNENDPGFYAQSQDLGNPLYKSKKAGANHQKKGETNLYEDYDNPEMYEAVKDEIYENENSRSVGRNARPVTQVGYDYVDDSKEPGNSTAVGYAVLNNVPENIYADTNQHMVEQNLFNEQVDYKNTEGLVPGYAALGDLPDNVYAETTTEARNDYSLLAGTTPQEAYASLEDNKYATLEENQFLQENYQTLNTAGDGNQKSFSKYVGW